MTRKKTEADDALGWSYPIDQDEIGAKPYTKTIVAGTPELKSLAARLEVLSVDALAAEIVMERVPGNKAVVHVQGTLKADVAQACVVTDVPVKEHIEEDFEAWYADPSSFTSIAKARHDRAGKGADAEVQIIEERDDPEPMVDGKIDLGDLVTQYLSLSLNPYPRAPGVSAEALGVIPDGQEPAPLRKNPFEALKDWKAKGK